MANKCLSAKINHSLFSQIVFRFDMLSLLVLSIMMKFAIFMNSVIMKNYSLTIVLQYP